MSRLFVRWLAIRKEHIHYNIGCTQMIYPTHMFHLFFILYLLEKQVAKAYFSNVYNHVFNTHCCNFLGNVVSFFKWLVQENR